MTAPKDAASPTLTVTGGPHDGQSLVVRGGGPCSLGSAADSTLQLDLANVDLAHAQVVWDSRGLILSDLDSSTGTIKWENDLKGLGWGLVSIAGTGAVAAAEARRRQEAAHNAAVTA